jgi:hypothetical protein
MTVDGHEPVIRDSWGTPTAHDRLLLSGVGHRSLLGGKGGFEPFGGEDKDGAGKGRRRDKGEHQVRANCDGIASSEPGKVFLEMRSVFESAGGTGVDRSVPSEPGDGAVGERVSVGAAPHGVRWTSSPTGNEDRIVRDGDGYDSASGRRGGGFIADAGDDEEDESSALLGGLRGGLRV